MRDRTFERHLNVMLSDDLLAQLRTARRAMSTTELRDNAPRQPLRPGSVSLYPPLQERVYRALRRLAASGSIICHTTAGRTVTWSAACNPTVAGEIAWLKRAFDAPVHSSMLVEPHDGTRS